ncbi:uncharacterized protein VTP21DRAFT_9800 [Calcarisporiella thermophila]|uniref:uncharacterized protein n=1 Tax=Calcarisporiella thermophila TaxID=911321 RepID=UPI0037431133
MKIYRAETGKCVYIDSSNISNLDSLRRELERMAQIPVKAQILMTSLGTQLREDMIPQVLRGSGNDEHVIVLYDRRFLESPHDMVELLSDSEKNRLEPPVQSISPESLQSLKSKRSSARLSQQCDMFLTFFRSLDMQADIYATTIRKHAQLCETLLQEHRIQAMALNIALVNMEAHCKNVTQELDSLNANAQRELMRQANILQSVPKEMELLRRVHIHPKLVASQPGAAVSGNVTGTLADYANMEEISTWLASASKVHGELINQVQKLEARIKSIQSGTETLLKQGTGNIDLNSLDVVVAEVKECVNQANANRERVQRDITRVQELIAELQPGNSPSLPPSNSLPPTAKKVFEAFENLVTEHMDVYYPEMAKLDQFVRNQTSYLLQSKSKMTVTLLQKLYQVSRIQSSIMETITSGIRRLEEDLRAARRGSFGDSMSVVASRSQYLLIAYGSTLVEIVRRKEYSALLLQNAHQVVESFARLRAVEQERRDTFRVEVGKYLPFRVEGMEASAPSCEVMLTNSATDQLPDISKSDFKDFLGLINRLRLPSTTPSSPRLSMNRQTSQQQSQSQRSASSSDPLAKLESILTRLMHQVDSMRLQFERGMMEQYADGGESPVPGTQRSSPAAVEAKRQNGEGDIQQVQPNPSTPLPFTAISVKKPLVEGRAEMEEVEVLLQAKQKELDSAEEKLKHYEERIRSLEMLLRRNYQRTPFPSAMPIGIPRRFSAQTNPSPMDYNMLEMQPVSPPPEYMERASSRAEDKNSREELEKRCAKLEEENRRLQGDLERVKGLYGANTEGTKASPPPSQQEKGFTVELQRPVGVGSGTGQGGQKMAVMKDRIDELEAMNREISQAWNTKVRELEQLREEERQERQRLLSEIEPLRLKIVELEHTHEEEMEKLEEHIAELEEILEAERTEHEEEKKKLEARLEGVQSEKESCQEEQGELKRRLSQAREVVVTAERDRVSKSAELERLQGRIADIHRKALQCLGEMEDMGENSREGGEPPLEAFEAMLTKIFDEYCAKRGELERLNRDLQEQQSKPPILEASLQLAQKQIDERTELCELLSNQLRAYYTSMQTLIAGLGLSLKQEESEKPHLEGSHIDDTEEHRTLLRMAQELDLNEVVAGVRRKFVDAVEVAKKWQRDCRTLREKYGRASSESSGKIAFRNFKAGDLALFLPTRNSTAKGPWAAFNINFPHYFLEPSEAMSKEIRNREWIVARIVRITEHVVDKEPGSNPYGLADGIKFYTLEAESWHSSRHHHKSSTSSSSNSQVLNRSNEE